MRLGLYGGSFDPIHRGHVEPILAAKEAAGLDRVLYLPTARPPHKEGRLLAPARHRLAMVELALAEHPELEVSTYEMGLDGPAYTVETLEHFQAQWPGNRLSLIIGADSFLQLHRWYRYEDIPKLARLVVLVRPGSDISSTAAELPATTRALLHDPTVVWVKNRAVSASSTEIRRRLCKGEPVTEGWLSEPVLNYIRTNGLYAVGEPDGERK